jgi:hypothetical protein
LLGRLASLASGADYLVRAAELAELALVEAGADVAARANALEIASVLDMNLDRADRAETRATEAAALYQQLGDANGAARILDSRVMATFLDGRIDDGAELLDRVANLFEDSGDLVHVITPRSTAGHGLVFAGRTEHGLEKTTAALQLARTIGHAEGQTYALWHTAEALASLRRGAESLEAGTAALTIATAIGHRGGQRWPGGRWASPTRRSAIPNTRWTRSDTPSPHPRTSPCSPVGQPPGPLWYSSNWTGLPRPSRWLSRPAISARVR